jgi:hypothetical protein
MTRYLFLILTLGSFGVPAAAQSPPPADLTGAWDVTLETPQGATTLGANLKQNGEAVTGDITSPMGTLNLTGKMVDDTLSMAYSVPVQGNTMEITMTGKLAGDLMKGTIVIAGMGEIPWTAKRKPAADALATAAPAAAATPPPAAGNTATGKWNIALKMGQGEFPVTAELAQTGDQVNGTIALPMNPSGVVNVTGTMTGSTLKLEFAVPTPQGDMPVTMTGELGASGFAGKAALGPLGEADWTATRVQ